jgi:imidazolonepropionase-like amidohydrolase
MRLEKAFSDAGGTLLAGTDPTGIGGILPGYSGKREIELLVEEGFTVPQAIKIATLNGARYLERDREVGSLEVGKRADVVVIDGDIAADVTAIERMPLVFKAGIGIDPAKIFAAFKGKVGLY